MRQGVWQRAGSRGWQWHQGPGPVEGGQHRWAAEGMEVDKDFSCR